MRNGPIVNHVADAKDGVRDRNRDWYGRVVGWMIGWMDGRVSRGGVSVCGRDSSRLALHIHY